MAGVKITDLTTLLEAASDDLLYIVDVSDNTDGPQGTSKSIEVANIRGYKVYTALLTQTGTDAPTAIVMENTIGDVEWIYLSVGQYKLQLNNAFTINKTIIFPNVSFNATVAFTDPRIIGFADEGDDDYILVSSFNNSGLADNIILNFPVEIRVYN